MFKRIVKHEHWSNCNMLFINGFVLTSSTNLRKAFFKFQIRFWINGRKPKNIQTNNKVWIVINLNVLYQYLTRQAPQTNGKLFSNFRMIFLNNWVIHVRWGRHLCQAIQFWLVVSELLKMSEMACSVMVKGVLWMWVCCGSNYASPSSGEASCCVMSVPHRSVCCVSSQVGSWALKFPRGWPEALGVVYLMSGGVICGVMLCRGWHL